MRHGGELGWSNVNAVAFEFERILFGRKTEIGAGFRQDIGFGPSVVVGELSFEFAERFLPVFQAVFL
jgi:hypothetical protein